jgi:hypothetical protein
MGVSVGQRFLADWLRGVARGVLQLLLTYSSERERARIMNADERYGFEGSCPGTAVWLGRELILSLI